MQAIEIIKPGIDRQLTHVISSGSYGTVYKYKGRAVKRMIINEGNTHDKIMQQIMIHRRLSNYPNIVKTYGSFRDQKSYYIQMELCQRSLGSYMRQKSRCFSEQEAENIMRQIVSGCRVLISLDIIHRDLKPDNILMNSIDQLKLADFGTSKTLDSKGDFKNNILKTSVGTPLYCAPEVLRGEPYTTNSDVFSLGVIYYELLMNQIPWKGVINDYQLIEFYADKQKFLLFHRELEAKPLSRAVKVLIKGMLKTNPQERYGWEQVFEYFNFTYNSSPTKLRKQIQKQNKIPSRPLRTDSEQKYQQNKQKARKFISMQKKPLRNNQPNEVVQFNAKIQKPKSKGRIVIKEDEDKQEGYEQRQRPKIKKSMNSISEEFLRGMMELEFLLSMSKQQAKNLNRKSYQEMNQLQKQIFSFATKNFNEQVRCILKKIYQCHN